MPFFLLYFFDVLEKLFIIKFLYCFLPKGCFFFFHYHYFLNIIYIYIHTSVNDIFIYYSKNNIKLHTNIKKNTSDHYDFFRIIIAMNLSVQCVFFFLKHVFIYMTSMASLKVKLDDKKFKIKDYHGIIFIID